MVACNNAGCSEIDSANPATFVGGPPAPASPPNQRYVWQGSTTVVSWDAVSGADHYTVYYDDFFSSSCSLSFGGSPSFCDELATNIRGTSYTHTSPDEDDNYYWVVACNSGGCSDIDSANSARFIDTRTPDLVVDTPTVSDDSPDAGERFTLRATVRNQGNGSSDSTTLRYYRSTDSTITTGDAEVDSDFVFGLDPSETSNESARLTAPSTGGTYYYGACVDAVSAESDTGNNCSTAVTVTVGAAPAPDLVVDAPTVSESAPTAGSSITLRVTVRNQGNGQSDSTTLRYYRSTDSTITTGDTEVGTDSVSGLAAAGSSPQSITLTAPSKAGTYYYGACVDAVTDETDTSNNCSDGVMVAVVAVVPGAPTGLLATASGPTRIDLSWSAPANNGGAGITGYRIEVSTDGSAWSDLVANSTGTTYSHTGLTAGSTRHYRVSAINSVGLGPVSNIATGTTESSNQSAPDLVVETPAVDDGTPDAGAAFTLSATVRNQGDGASAPTTLRYYRSTDSAISASDTPVGTDSVGGLNASATSPESITLTAPDTPGTYHYGACADAVAGETDPGNNCSTAVTVFVQSTPPVPAGDYDTDNDGLIEISNLSQLNAVRWDPDGNGEVSSHVNRGEYYDAFPGAEDGIGCPNSGCIGYELVANLNFDTNGNGRADAGDPFWNGGAGWQPMRLASAFDGGGHTIANLYINRANEDHVGLFGTPSADRIQGVGLISANVTGRKYVGGLVGNSSGGTISDSYVTGSVTGTDDRVGGLIGQSISGTVTASYSTGSVSGDEYVGGLVGYSGESTISDSYATGSVTGTGDRVGGLIGQSISGTVTASYSTGSVSGDEYVGGLVGYSGESTISDSYATGSVTGTGDRVGGLIGQSISGTITASYATGSVSGDEYVGGLVGYSGESTISASYATGSVTGDGDRVGGLIGNSSSGTITASYATGSVSGDEHVGGLIGYNYNAAVSVSYWDTQTTGLSSSDGGIGKTTVELQSPTGYSGIFAAWNMDLDDDGSNDDPWDFGTSTQYPVLKYQNLNPGAQRG